MSKTSTGLQPCLLDEPDYYIKTPIQKNMSTTLPSTPPSKAMLWTGRVLSALPVLMLVMSAVMKIKMDKKVVDGFTQMGYPSSLIVPLGVLELVCTLLYVLPPTSVLGAILLTGYLGGAVEATVRGGGLMWLFPALMGVLVWGGLFLRDGRIRALIPLKR